MKKQTFFFLDAVAIVNKPVSLPGAECIFCLFSF